MIVGHGDGTVTVHMAPPVTLRRATLLEYAQLHDQVTAMLSSFGTGSPVADVDRLLADDAAGVVTAAMLLDVLGDRTVDAADLPVWLVKPDCCVEIIRHLAEPINPWTAEAPPRPARKGGDPDAGKVWPSVLPGWQGRMAVMYRALTPMPPSAVDGLELWQAAAYMRLDEDRYGLAGLTEHDRPVPGVVLNAQGGTP